MKNTVLALSLALILLPVLAAATTVGDEDGDMLTGGFVTSCLNTALSKAMEKGGNSGGDTLTYGRDISRYVTAPVFGGYLIGSYKYSSKAGGHNGAGFNARLLRVYVNGTVLRDFYYRVQMELNGTTHLKDMYIEWRQFPEIRVKFGQFKRCFSFENPYNPWEVGVGDYSQLVKKLSGFSDHTYAEYSGSNGGRDIGFQLYGDLLKVGNDKHRLLHYEMGVYNGQGINTSDANGKKDWMGTVQLQPVEGLYVGVFGWKGSFTQDDVTVRRDRWAVGAKYDHKDWTVRAEYAHHTGHKISDYVPQTDEEPAHWEGTGKADAWYATFGVPCTRWMKCYVKYDVYRSDATNSSLTSIYSICPNLQLHRNLQFQVQYNYVCDKTASRHNYHELWVESYIRF